VQVGSTAQVSKAEVTAKARGALIKAAGQTPRSFTCPGGLDAKVGASERCTLTDNAGNTFGVTVKITAFNGSTGNYTLGVQVDNTPSSSPPSS
jgi:hypothetical protein